MAPNGVASSDVVGERVLELLELYCGECHAGGAAKGGFGQVLDVGALIASGAIVPSSSATSPLMLALANGSMPPEDYRPLPTQGDIALVALFIDQLDMDVPACDALPLLGTDELLAALATDIATLSAEARPFTRYLSLAYASNAGLCGPAIERERRALFQALNSVSLAAEIRVPVAIDRAELLYRVDLRDYFWNRPIDLEADGTDDFADAWLAVLAGAGPYAREYRGPEADALKRDARTPVPFLPVNAFVHAVATGDLYYSLVGVRPVVEETRLELGVDIVAAVVDASVIDRAGFDARGDMVSATRFPQALPGRAVWMLDPWTRSVSDSLFTDPFGWEYTEIASIFQLPNGLQAYAVEDQDGIRASAARAHGSYCGSGECEPLGLPACHGCHASGLMPLRDVVRQIVTQRQSQYDSFTFDAVQRLYPLQSELDALVAADNLIHRSALERAGVPWDAPDALSRVFYQFERAPLEARRVAGELGVTLDALRAGLLALDPRMSVLSADDGAIDRTTFSEALPFAACSLHRASRNVPLDCP